METSWENTREALKQFAMVLTCFRCKRQLTNASRYTTCGHIFCKQCIENDAKCMICNIHMQPQKIFNDHLVESLISYCNILAGVVQEKDLWPAKRNSNAMQLLPMVKKTWTANNTRNIIPKKNINKQNDKGETLLHRACLKYDVDYVKSLLAAGANPNTKDHTGWTPLQETVNFGYTIICQILLENNALPNIPGVGNRTPLHDAAMNNRLLEAKLLLEYSANKDVFDEHGRRPIDYCEPYTDMWNILKDENELNITATANLNCTLNQSLSVTQSFNRLVIYASNLQEKNKRYLEQMALKYKIKIVSAFQPYVTHVITEANKENVVELSYDIMMALLHGCWLLNTEWIQLGMELGDMLTGDLEIFEISGAPIIGIPTKARENAQIQNPGLFDKCNFYFSWQTKNTYSVNNIQLTKDALMTLVQVGGGKILKREPRPEDIDTKEQLIPFHVANNPSHSLYKCTHYIIYIPERDAPLLKYNMSHIKSLPLMWLIECIEKFTLIDPSQLGLL